MQRVYDFLKQAQTYYLATTDKEQPKIRPFGTIDLYENKLYIQTGKSKECSKQMRENPKISICTMKDGEWIRIDATAVNDDSIEAKEHMLSAYPSLRDMYDSNDDNTQVLYLKDATAEICSFTHEPIIIKF